MRVALFVETYLPYINGVVTHVKLLKEGLESLGHEVLVITADPGTYRHRLQGNVLHCPAKKFKKLYGYGLASPVSKKRMRILKNFDPDVLHIHQEFGVGLFGAMAAKMLKKPLVYTLHTMYDDYLYYIAPRKLIPAAKRVSHDYSRFLAKRATALTGPSAKVQEYFEQCGLHKHVNVVRNPVETETFCRDKITQEQTRAVRKQYDIPEDATLVCFCGRIGREKSVDVLLQFWKEAVTEQDNAYLMILGDGPCREELCELAASLGISDHVRFTGKVLHEELPPYYAASDLYITASLSDTNSISMLEGMSTGLPVLHILDKLNAGQVKHGVNGFIYESAEQMAQEIRDWKALPDEEKKALSERTRQSVLCAGATDLAKTIEGIYQSAIDSNLRELAEKA